MSDSVYKISGNFTRYFLSSYSDSDFLYVTSYFRYLSKSIAQHTKFLSKHLFMKLSFRSEPFSRIAVLSKSTSSKTRSIIQEYYKRIIQSSILPYSMSIFTNLSINSGLILLSFEKLKYFILSQAKIKD